MLGFTKAAVVSTCSLEFLKPVFRLSACYLFIDPFDIFITGDLQFAVV